MSGVWGLGLMLAAAALGQADDDPVARGGDALRRGGFPWYEASADAVAAPPAERARDDFSGRHSTWSGNATPPRPPKMPTFTTGPTGISVVSVVMWVLIALLLASLVAALTWAALRHRRIEVLPTSWEKEVGRKIDRVEELPVPVDAAVGDLLEQARRHFEAGRFREAVICLFSHQLIQLDNRRLIELERGKTNRQYLRELRPRPGLRTRLQVTMVAFEDAFFGGRDVSREQVEECWRSQGELQRELEVAT